ncbi:type 2 lanthipeptide synthetase LanM family protein [Kribbella albertanoniae]|uniref:Type 2 lantipeptide synthetase LanM n=1 Tax=Kribbella albertanoniae TaxID=1266829 RepID=A0A4R4Q463_9ACTN|nr:type 2 lanthipeptide synthetase LanM family protein [Kribbella albertanoniae]TDC29662.1 type 2 lantipeptide synthetase LanM [Kribbella albertanoniae]
MESLHAVPLADRGPGQPGPVAEVAERRRERWRDFLPDADLWVRRLVQSGLDEATLLQLLSESEHAPRIGPVPGDPGDFLSEDFERAAAGLLGPARRRMLAEVTSAAGASEVVDCDSITTQLFEPLCTSVHRMMSRTITLELHLAKLRGELGDGTSAERYQKFLASLDDLDRQRRLFTDYPVLWRQLSVLAGQAVTNARILTERLVSDAAMIGEVFGGGADPGAVDTVFPGTGDRHRRGQSVARIRWTSGLEVIYKPRSLRVDQHFTDLIEHLNAAGLTHPLRTARAVERGEYGWVEFITAKPCADLPAVRRFYHRQGSLLALLELLGTNDMHAENLIASGEDPVLIDLETLLQPGLPAATARAGDAENAAATAARRSVLQVGLLPTLTWRSKDGGGVDISGLGSRPGQLTAVGYPVLTDAGTDAMRVQLERLPVDLPDHRPVAKDVELNLLDYTDDLIAGYTELHRLCRHHKTALLADDGPLAAFAGDTVRVVLRSTMAYATVLQTGFHPDLLRDALERDRHFDYLWRQVVDLPMLADFIAAEQRDLWRNDIPFFTCRADDGQLVDSDDRPVGAPFQSGLELARARLATQDEEHLDRQLALIRGSLATAAINAADEVVLPEYALRRADRPASKDELLKVAASIGDQLAATAFEARGSAQWLGLSSQQGRNWTLGPLEPDLFNGLSGVALFLAELGRATGDRRHLELAARAVATIRSQLARDLAAGVGGMAGQPGIAYALARLSSLLGDESLLTAAAELTAGLGETIASDNQYDLVAGSAGTIAALRAVQALRPDSTATAMITAAADRLLATSEPWEPGIGWRPAGMLSAGLAEVPLAGLGHGMAGIGWALAEAGRLTGSPSYTEAARQAIEYERTLYDAGREAWRDVRTTSGADGVSIRAWCHGSVGIGLSRLRMLDVVPGAADELQAAIEDTRLHGFGLSHSLCHGDAGSIELLLLAALALDDADLLAEAQLHAAGLAAGIRAYGPVCGVPFGTPTPSLMVGLAGIGFGLLRAADPVGVPSVALLDW